MNKGKKNSSSYYFALHMQSITHFKQSVLLERVRKKLKKIHTDFLMLKWIDEVVFMIGKIICVVEVFLKPVG